MFKEILFSGWHFMRFLRLGIGIFIAIQAIQFRDALSGIIAALFLFQAFTNTGCCGVNGCVTNPNDVVKKKTQEVEFEEIK
ncbi:MAG TPA: hypothetical protein PK323_01565 [Bacteroidia bacterium]|nr:hypothetical protein [Bacteroidia bacterium]